METIQQIAHKVRLAGGEAWLIGGSVREMLYKQAHPDTFIHPSKDFDMEIYGIQPEVFEKVIQNEGDVDFVGKQFGVYHLRCYNGVEIDFNFPRADSIGRKPDVEIDIWMDKCDACKRRNFTVNSAMYNPLDGQLIDYFGAERDIKRLCLHPTSSRFVDDPLRPLIGMFLAGAYDMWPTLETEHYGRIMSKDYDTLPPSRIWGEWWKWATRSVAPSQGLVYLQKIGWLVHYPELRVLDIIPQDPEWHPEGSVWQHTLLTCDEAAFIAKDWDAERRGILVLAALCHDLDKALFTQLNEDGRWVSAGHDQGIQAEKFLNRIYCPTEIKERVLALVRTHMLHIGGVKVKRLLKMLGDNRPVDWLAIVTADHSARPPLPKETPVKATELYHQMVNLPPDPIKPVLMGRHLLELGIKPGPEMGQLLKLAYEFQLENDNELTPEFLIEYLKEKGEWETSSN